MRDKDDESRIEAYMQAKMTHIKIYNECMNLADGLDVEKFADLVRADERQKIEEQFNRRIIRQRNHYGKTMQKLLADEREACAEIAEKMGNKMKEGYEKTNDLIFKFNCYALKACAISIRARGEK